MLRLFYAGGNILPLVIRDMVPLHQPQTPDPGNRTPSSRSKPDKPILE